MATFNVLLPLYIQDVAKYMLELNAHDNNPHASVYSFAKQNGLKRLEDALRIIDEPVSRKDRQALDTIIHRLSEHPAVHTQLSPATY